MGGYHPFLLEACLDPVLEAAESLDVGTVLGFRVGGSDNDASPPEQWFFDRTIQPTLDKLTALFQKERVQ